MTSAQDDIVADEASMDASRPTNGIAGNAADFAGHVQQLDSICASTAAPFKAIVPAAALAQMNQATDSQCQDLPENDRGDFAGKEAAPRRQMSEPPDAKVWKIDGSNGHYQSRSSLCLVIWAQILYIVSLVIVIPTAGRYLVSLGAEGTIYFGLIVGISSIVDPLVCRIWMSVLRVTSLKKVLLMNATINVTCSIMYALASLAGTSGGVAIAITSRCLLGFGSVQTAYLQYLGRAVSVKKVTFAHFITTASIAYGFAFGIVTAFALSLVAAYMDWDQNLTPAWCTALLWLLYIPMHCLIFVEPDHLAGIVDPESKIRLTKEMRPEFRREPFSGLLPCMASIFVIAVVKGAFEVMTIEMTMRLWNLDVMKSALFLGTVMFIVALTTLLAYVMQKRVGECRIFTGGLIGATLLLPAYYIPIGSHFQEAMNSHLGMALYLIISIVMLSFFNVGRTIAFSLTTELPSPHWRDYFLGCGSSLFTMGRGVGPILVGAVAAREVVLVTLLLGCVVASIAVCYAHLNGKFEHDEHEVGPAMAEVEDDENLRQRIEKWLEFHGVKATGFDLFLDCESAGTIGTKDLESAHEEAKTNSLKLESSGTDKVPIEEKCTSGRKEKHLDSSVAFHWVFT